MSNGKRFQTKYSSEFKIAVIMDMRENHMTYSDTVRKYWGVETKTDCSRFRSRLRLWERIYLEEGAAGLMTERRGRKSTGRPRKQPLDKSVEEDLIAENQRLKERNEYLEMELEYLKKLDALVRKRMQAEKKKQK